MSEFIKIWPDVNKPWKQRKQEILDILCREEYGRLLPAPDNVTWEVLSEDKRYCDGKATLRRVMLTVEFENKRFSFPFKALLTGSKPKNPFVVNIAFEREFPNKYMFPDLFCRNGVSVMYLCYEDVTKDNGDFTDGLAGVLYPDGKRRPDDPGKIAMWAWAAQRVLDYALSLDCLDPNKAAVGGHSRLGKTSLLAGASDERFKYVFCNNSGCSGAALSRDKEGETIEDITRVFGYWFCENYKKYANNEDKLPFDQHFLLGAIAPAKLCVGSAEQDRWAGPYQEYMSCVLASEVYKKLGLTGLVAPDRMPVPGDNWAEGNIAYHYRDGFHFMRADDWKIYFDIINS